MHARVDFDPRRVREGDCRGGAPPRGTDVMVAMMVNTFATNPLACYAGNVRAEERPRSGRLRR
jgi:hypothetical protein